ncbi:MAG: serine/threonine protein kinase [Myxococcales bacterium]|nr:serine/threonine protein kinase [Myxococcales bacterium]MCB9577254.1 serine/threonine protein kinase [Polyangiaceae bacterium]
MALLFTRPAQVRYELSERLGAGGFAEAWRAQRQSPMLDDEVCLKIPRRPLDAGLRRNLLEEARLLARIRHPNVVTLLDAVEDEAGRVLLVLELVRGVDLGVLCSRVREGHRYSDAVVAHVGACLCRALAAANAAVPGGIVHRDVSPRNVLVGMDGQVKLSDFGIARAFDRESWTVKGRVKGKLMYLSPEQLRGGTLDVRSDLFAVGIVLHELASGVHPFWRGDRTATLAAIAEGDCRFCLSGDRPLARVLARLLAPEREARPWDARAALALLEPIADAPVAERVLAAEATRRGPGLVRARPRLELAVAQR